MSLLTQLHLVGLRPTTRFNYVEDCKVLVRSRVENSVHRVTAVVKDVAASAAPSSWPAANC